MIAGRLRWLAAGAKPAKSAAGARVRRRHAGADRSRHATPRLAAPAGRAARRWRRPRAAWSRCGRHRHLRRAPEGRTTLKRALTNPRLFSGIGNACSDGSCIARDLAGHADARARRRGAAAPARGHARGAAQNGPNACATRPARPAAGRRRSRSTRDGGARPLWPALPGVRRARFSASCTPTTRPTTAHAARPTASCSPIVRCRDCSKRWPRRSTTFEDVHRPRRCAAVNNSVATGGGKHHAQQRGQQRARARRSRTGSARREQRQQQRQHAHHSVVPHSSGLGALRQNAPRVRSTSTTASSVSSETLNRRSGRSPRRRGTSGAATGR